MGQEVSRAECRGTVGATSAVRAWGSRLQGELSFSRMDGVYVSITSIGYPKGHGRRDRHLRYGC